MKNVRTLAAALLLSMFSASYALAEFTMGVTAAMAYIEADGTETEGNINEVNQRGVTHLAPVGSIFVEMNDIVGSGLTLGIDYIPMAAEVSDGLSRTDTERSVTGTTAGTSLTRNQKAQAEIDNHITLYGTYNIGDIYLKAGYVSADLITTESLPTGSSYGDASLDGITVGIGYESELVGNSIYRLEATHTSYDDINLTSSTARAGVTNNTKISADLDVTQVKASIGYKF